MLIHLKQRQSTSKMNTPERYTSIKLQSEVQTPVLPDVFSQTQKSHSFSRGKLDTRNSIVDFS